MLARLKKNGETGEESSESKWEKWERNSASIWNAMAKNGKENIDVVVGLLEY